mmetsp:Transcript_761/g.2277  ORF Transcript_761/g.2277 Transcript_761/m.2277 type:complete len:169 (-) Transcript_761:1332-1838(-)
MTARCRSRSGRMGSMFADESAPCKDPLVVWTWKQEEEVVETETKDSRRERDGKSRDTLLKRRKRGERGIETQNKTKKTNLYSYLASLCSLSWMLVKKMIKMVCSPNSFISSSEIRCTLIILCLPCPRSRYQDPSTCVSTRASNSHIHLPLVSRLAIAAACHLGSWAAC